MHQFSNQSFGGQQGFNTLNQFGTNPQTVQSHIQGSLHQGQPAQYTNFAGATGSPMHVGASNPQMVQEHIAQDLGHMHQATNAGGYAPQAGYNHGALNQVMNAAPAQVHGVQGQQFGGHAAQAHQPAQFSNSAFGQFGSNPQMVREHIAQDLHGQQFGGQAPQAHQQAQFSNSAFGQFGSNPQMVRQHIQQDLSQGQGAMTAQQAGAMHGHGLSYGQGVTAQSGGAGQMTNSAFGQFSTNPQSVRQQIQQDLNSF